MISFARNQFWREGAQMDTFFTLIRQTVDVFYRGRVATVIHVQSSKLIRPSIVHVPDSINRNNLDTTHCLIMLRYSR
jgi:hypothetical protein